MKSHNQVLSHWNCSSSFSLKLFSNHLNTTARDRNEEGSNDDNNDVVNKANLPPELPSTCCMSGCANCVWLDYAEETVKYYENLGMKMELEELLNTVDDNIQDPLVKAFIRMELKSKYLFGSK